MAILFDDRSGRSSRNTGWERYSRLLLNELKGALVPAEVSADGVTRRLFTDWVSLPLRSRTAEAAHFPTFPPSDVMRRRCIYTLHDLTWWKYPESASRMGRIYYRPLAERALKRCHVITVSETVRTELIADMGLTPTQVTATPLGVVPLPVPEAPEVRERPYFLAVGTLEPRKNFQRLVRAYLQSGLSTEYELVVVGRLGWSSPPENVTWLGSVSDAHLAALYAGARAFFSPSLYEGFGLPVLEALSSGIQVFCSDIPVYREVAGPHAEYFDPLDVEAMAQAIIESFRSERISAWERRAWLSRFTWQKTAERTLEAYAAAGVTGI